MKKYSQQEASDIFKSHDIILLGQYEGSKKPSLCICKCGKQDYITLHTVQKGRRCSGCNASNNAKKVRLTHEQVENEIQLLNMKLVSTYQSFHEPLILICECGNQFKMSLPNIRVGKRCGCKYQKGESHHSWVHDREALKQRNKFKKLCYSLVRRSLKGQAKTNKTRILLNYSAEELQTYITQHPRYSECLKTGKPIVIDHIFPLKAFADYNLLNEENLWLINHLTNLQPSIKKWNSEKNDFYEKTDFELFLCKHKIIDAIFQTTH